MAIGGYFINDYWWLFYCKPLAVILLVVIDGSFINGYFINGYWWLLYYKLLFIIICYITTIDDYCIISFFIILCYNIIGY
jgi:hypothetical protein